MAKVAKLQTVPKILKAVTKKDLEAHLKALNGEFALVPGSVVVANDAETIDLIREVEEAETQAKALSVQILAAKVRLAEIAGSAEYLACDSIGKQVFRGEREVKEYTVPSRVDRLCSVQNLSVSIQK